MAKSLFWTVFSFLGFFICLGALVVLATASGVRVFDHNESVFSILLGMSAPIIAVGVATMAFITLTLNTNISANQRFQKSVELLANDNFAGQAGGLAMLTQTLHENPEYYLGGIAALEAYATQHSVKARAALLAGRPPPDEWHLDNVAVSRAVYLSISCRKHAPKFVRKMEDGMTLNFERVVLESEMIGNMENIFIRDGIFHNHVVRSGKLADVVFLGQVTGEPLTFDDCDFQKGEYGRGVIIDLKVTDATKPPPVRFIKCRGLPPIVRINDKRLDVVPSWSS